MSLYKLDQRDISNGNLRTDRDFLSIITLKQKILTKKMLKSRTDPHHHLMLHYQR